jgi:hypothetical protein
MATRELLSPAQRAQMLCIPEDLSDQLLARYYTFSDDDLALIKQRRRPNDPRLDAGFMVALCAPLFLSLSRCTPRGLCCSRDLLLSPFRNSTRFFQQFFVRSSTSRGAFL